MAFDSLEVLVELQDDTYIYQDMMRLVQNFSVHVHILSYPPNDVSGMLKP